MTNLLHRVEVSLRSFYIFNSNFGRKEGEEHEKILFYHPKDIELNTKIKDVGLSEAIIAFTDTFNPDNGCEVVRTQKTAQLFYQAEPDFWMVLVLNVPKEIRTKDGVEYADYRNGEVHDAIYRRILEQSYHRFRLLEGTFDMILNAPNGETPESPLEHLRQRLEQFFEKYIASLKLPACNVIQFMRSIQYLPLDKFLFLRVHNFVNMIRATFPTISEAVFLYNEHIVCGGKLDPIDLYTLQEYIVDTLLQQPATEDREPTTKVFLHDNGSFVSYNVILFRTTSASLCLFSESHRTQSKETLEELHNYVQPQLTRIACDIGEHLAKQQQQQPQPKTCSALSLAITTTTDSESTSPKYIFVNEQSLKHLSNIVNERGLPNRAQSIPANVVGLIADLSNTSNKSEADKDDTATAPSFEEILVKSTTDFWIVKRCCNWRQYFVVIFSKKATLLDVTNEAERIFEQELTDDVFFDK